MNAVSKLALISLCSLSLSISARMASAGEDVPGATAGKGPVKKALEAKKDAAEELREKRKQLKEEIKDKREAIKEGNADAGGDVKDAKKELKEARQDLKEAWAKLRETRKERRQEHRDEVKKKWGDLHKHPAVKAELKMHAWRVARLKRIRAVADSEGKKDAVARVDKLMDKENARHQKHMDILKSKGGAE